METASYPQPSRGLHRPVGPYADDSNNTTTTTTTTTTTSSSNGQPANRSYASDVEAGEALRDLKLRLRAAKEDSAHYRSLCARAESTFQSHRRDLEGLMATEREGRLERQLQLREALQQALDDSRGVLAKIEALRAEQEAATREGLDAVRSEHADRMSRLEELIGSLREECAEVTRYSHAALAAHNAEEFALERALRLQVALHDELQKVKDLVLQVRAGPSERGRRGGGGVSPSRSRWQQRCGHSGDEEVGGQRRSRAGRIFLPSGLVDNSPQRRAPSPTSHHVLALLSTIQRQNYLRPREYEARHGYGCSGGVSPQTVSPTRAGRGAASDEINPHRGDSPFSRRLRALNDAELAVEEAELVGTHTHTHDHAWEAADASPPLIPRSQSTTRPAWERGIHAENVVGPSCAPHAAVRSSSALDDENRVPRTSPAVRSGAMNSAVHGMGSGVDLYGDCDDGLASRRAAPPVMSAAPYYGRRVNALVRALLDDVRVLRGQYAMYQAQLRDPCGDSVEASQQMRLLMRMMDDKVDQVRDLRVAQAKKTDQLRWHETMQDIQRDNAYSEGLYRRLRDL